MTGNPVSQEFWNIEDLSAYLKIKQKTLYGIVNQIPHYRVGKLLRFKRQEIDAWMENNKAGINDVPPHRNRRIKSPKKTNIHIDGLIRQAIDQLANESYNPGNGKPDHVKGLGKEVKHGLI